MGGVLRASDLERGNKGAERGEKVESQKTRKNLNPKYVSLILNFNFFKVKIRRYNWIRK